MITFMSVKVCFDLDGTLLTDARGNYASAVPIPDRVEKLKKMYSLGYTIIIQTARSYHWNDFTTTQLDTFGIPYHILEVGGKIHADLYVDDKAINAKDYFDE